MVVARVTRIDVGDICCARCQITGGEVSAAVGGGGRLSDRFAGDGDRGDTDGDGLGVGAAVAIVDGDAERFGMWRVSPANDAFHRAAAVGVKVYVPSPLVKVPLSVVKVFAVLLFPLTV